MTCLASRIVLTERCNAACAHCFNKDARQAGDMDVAVLFAFLRRNSRALAGAELKIMGGEPTLHPEFREVVVEGARHYRLVSIFTNGLRLPDILTDTRIQTLDLRGRLNFVLNGSTFDLRQFERYSGAIGRIWLHNVVTAEHADRVVERVRRTLPHAGQIQYVVSPDTGVDLFDPPTRDRYRETWSRTLGALLALFREHGATYSYDHCFPLCFYTQEMLDALPREKLPPGWSTMHDQRCCGNRPTLGLIDHDFSLYYCNQTRVRLGSILDDQGRPRALEEVEAMLRRGAGVKSRLARQLRPECRRCPALDVCKLGCYYNTLASTNPGCC